MSEDDYCQNMMEHNLLDSDYATILGFRTDILIRIITYIVQT